jgi:hypothetical protein
MTSSIFISYNPNSDIEQTLAVRLHTIGAVHGFTMLLPDRTGFYKSISEETKNRIRQSDYFILFSTTQISNVVYQEISFAYSHIQDKSRILVIYDESAGLDQKLKDKFTYVGISRSSKIEIILQRILSEIKRIQTKRNTQNGFLSTLGGILLTGIALFALSSALDEPAKRRKKKPLKRKIAPKKVSRNSKRIAV